MNILLILDVVLAMVDVYNALPHLGYDGKYPPAIVSPQDTGRDTPRKNGAGIKEREINHSENMDKSSLENGDKADTPGQPMELSPPPTVPPAPPPPREPPQPHRDEITRRDERGRSPTLRARDTYRPQSPIRDYSRSRSRSRGSRGRSYSGERGKQRHIDRDDSPYRRGPRIDTYIPPPRKRSSDEDSSGGREKRIRGSDDEMSEGEVR